MYVKIVNDFKINLLLLHDRTDLIKMLIVTTQKRHIVLKL
jgi:hypothetical protein